MSISYKPLFFDDTRSLEVQIISVFLFSQNNYNIE